MFLKISGVVGESTDKSHLKEIDLIDWSWGLSATGSAHQGGGAGTGKVRVDDISLKKYVDSASHVLLDHICTGKHIDEIKLSIRKAGGVPLEYLVLTLNGALLTGVQTGGGGGAADRLVETITVTFAKFKFAYQPQKSDGSKDGGVKETSFDIVANSK